MSKDLERMSTPKLSLEDLKRIAEKKDISKFQSIVDELIDISKAEKTERVCMIICS